MSIKKSFSVLLFLVFSAISLHAQKDRVLFTYNNTDVYSSEFSRIYEKNLSIVNDQSQKDIDNYLNLYINYRLKLQEAYDLKMDTISSYIQEYKKYKSQLIDPYMNDDNKEKDLVQEAYQRMKTEINANHILARVKKDASPQDTLKAYNKVLDARNKILAGASFEKTAREVSEDPSAETNGGNLGYFTVFQMVYPFETVAYNTPKGEISMPFKTKFGYHIIKINDIRPAQGEIQVAHIMLKGDTEESREKIKNIKKQLVEGGDFAALAKSYSTDLATSMKGGILPKFTSNKMVKEFSDASFALKNIGDLSEPFKTRYGWHIVKLIKRFPIGTFEEMKPEIDKKVQRGQRARIIGRSVIDRLLKEYNISTDHDVLKLFKSLGWRKTEEAKNNEATLLVINGNKYPAKDFIKFINRRNRKKKIEEIFQDYKEEKVLNLYKEDLPNKFPELKHTLREYREGLLLFDLMQKKIWDKADKDSVGFANFFENNRDKYQWKERVQTTIITCDKEENAKTAQKMLKEGKDTDEIKKSITTGIIDVKEKAYQKDNKVFPKDFKFQKGISNVIDDKGQFMIIEIKETLPAGPKELDETRGRAISDFQDYIEQEWIKDLRSKYPVKINKKSLKKLKKKYK